MNAATDARQSRSWPRGRGTMATTFPFSCVSPPLCSPLLVLDLDVQLWKASLESGLADPSSSASSPSSSPAPSACSSSSRSCSSAACSTSSSSSAGCGVRTSCSASFSPCSRRRSTSLVSLPCATGEEISPGPIADSWAALADSPVDSLSPLRLSRGRRGRRTARLRRRRRPALSLLADTDLAGTMGRASSPRAVMAMRPLPNRLPGVVRYCYMQNCGCSTIADAGRRSMLHAAAALHGRARV